MEQRGPECQPDGQGLLWRQGPGISIHCHRPWWASATTSSLGLSKKRGMWSWLRKQEGQGN